MSEGEWKTGFFDCFSNCSDLLIGFFCPCVQAGLVTSKAGQSTAKSVLQCLLYPCLIPLLRYETRLDHEIDGCIMTDLAVGCCCPCCTVLQVKREYD